MKKLLFAILFLLSFNISIFAQEQNPIVVNENTATETVVTGTEFALDTFTIQVSPDSTIDNARISIRAKIGIRQVETDPNTTYKLFTKLTEQEIFNGTIGSYKQELESAVNNGVITNGTRNQIINKITVIYDKLFELFLDTSNTLSGNNKITLKAKKVIQ